VFLAPKFALLVGSIVLAVFGIANINSHLVEAVIELLAGGMCLIGIRSLYAYTDTHSTDRDSVD
jgi:hypothetical protein